MSCLLRSPAPQQVDGLDRHFRAPPVAGGDADDDDPIGESDTKAADATTTKSALSVRIASRFAAPVVSSATFPVESDDGCVPRRARRCGPAQV